MAFYGCEFNFDGIPCTEYGLMIATIKSVGGDTFMLRDIFREHIH